MTYETQRVLTGFLNLSEAEKRDFINQMAAYINMTALDQKKFEKSLQGQIYAIKMAIGPLSKPCPCCGK